jgi:hypothetical protein
VPLRQRIRGVEFETGAAYFFRAANQFSNRVEKGDLSYRFKNSVVGAAEYAESISNSNLLRKAARFSPASFRPGLKEKTASMEFRPDLLSRAF